MAQPYSGTLPSREGGRRKGGPTEAGWTLTTGAEGTTGRGGHTPLGPAHVRRAEQADPETGRGPVVPAAEERGERGDNNTGGLSRGEERVLSLDSGDGCTPL